MQPEPDTTNVRSAASALRRRGIALCRIDPGSKQPTYSKWGTRSLEAGDFGAGDQLGILGGPLSDCNREGYALVIIDLDARNALQLADAYLPTTAMMEGRAGKPRSHRYYLVPLATIPEAAWSTAPQAAAAAREHAGHPGPASRSFKASAGAEILKVIGTGAQVVCPPSKHPSGESREWEGGEPGEPAIVPWPLLWSAVCGLARECGATLPEAPKQAPQPSTNGTSGNRTDTHERARKYLAKMAPAISGQGGHDATFSAACAMVWGFALGIEDGYRLLAEHYNPRCKPEWSEKELRHKCEDANRVTHKHPLGYLRDKALPERNGHANHKAKPTEPAPAEPEPKRPQEAWEIIRDYFRERYNPAFKLGDSIHSEAEQRDVRRIEACAALPPDLIERLGLAIDVPLQQNGTPKGREAMPGLFKKWAGTGWKGLTDELPDEDSAALSDNASAAEEFRQLVREAMFHQIVLGTVVRGRTEEVTQTERRSLIGWCERLAKEGPWRDIRSYRCWVKMRVSAEGEITLAIAVRHELFAQLKADRRLVEMGPKRFARRAAKYGVGSSSQDDRPHGKRAIILDHDFIEDLRSGVPDEICRTSETATDGAEGCQVSGQQNSTQGDAYEPDI